MESDNSTLKESINFHQEVSEEDSEGDHQQRFTIKNRSRACSVPASIPPLREDTGSRLGRAVYMHTMVG